METASFLLGLIDRVALLVDESLGAHDLEGIVQRVQGRVRGPVGAEIAIGPGKVLAVVDGEVDVVKGVVGGAVDELFGPVARDHVAVVDKDGPDLDAHKQYQV